MFPQEKFILTVQSWLISFQVIPKILSGYLLDFPLKLKSNPILYDGISY